MEKLGLWPKDTDGIVADSVDTVQSAPSAVFCTVKILKFGTPQTIAIIVLKIEKFDVTLH